MSLEQTTTLHAAFDDYPHTRPLMQGTIKSDRVAFDFTAIRPANKFFKPMVREQKFDVSEMAIATYVQAKAYGKPITLLPATMMGRFLHGTLLCRAAAPLTPADLPGKRLGIRSYSQTTGVWVRGILANDYSVDPDSLRWFTQEDGHVAEYSEPAGVTRLPPDKNLLKMLREGELDAAIYGADLPKDPSLTSVIPNPEAAAQSWFAKYRVVPINHMVVITNTLSKSKPEAVAEVFQLLAKSKSVGASPTNGGIDFLPYGVEACRAALEAMIDYTVQQKLVPRRLEVDELFDDTTRTLGR